MLANSGVGMNHRNNQVNMTKALFFVVFYSFLLMVTGWFFESGNHKILFEWLLPSYLSPNTFKHQRLFIILGHSILTWLWWFFVLLLPVSLMMFFHKKRPGIPWYVSFLLTSIIFACIGICLVFIGGWDSCGPVSIVSEIGGWLSISHVIFWEEVRSFSFENAFLGFLFIFFTSIFDWLIVLSVGWIISGLVFKILFSLRSLIFSRSRRNID